MNDPTRPQADAPAPENPRPLQADARWHAVLDGAARPALEAALAAYVAGRRWYRTKTRGIRGVRVAHAFSMEGVDADARLLLLEVALDGIREDGTSVDTYVLPVAYATRAADPQAVVAELVVRGDAGETRGVLVDALFDPEIPGRFLAALQRGLVVEDRGATLTFHPMAALADVRDVIPGRLVNREQTNTSVVYGERFVGKIVRKLDAGESADLEMGRFLTESGYGSTPALAGWVDVRGNGSDEPSTVALLHAFVPNHGDAWGHALETLDAHLASSSDAGTGSGAGAYAPLARKLGRRVGEMHRLLAAGTGSFAPAPLDRATREGLSRAVETGLGRALDGLRAKAGSLDGEARALLGHVNVHRDRLVARLRAFDGLADAGLVTRIHGDLHLGQILFTGDDFVLIDFEGEPARPLEERKAKRSPLADVAGMLRSFHYAAVSAVRARKDVDGEARTRLRERAARWEKGASAELLAGWMEAAGDAGILPEDPAARRTVLDFFLLEKGAYEVAYEMDNRPDWVAIPLEGLRDILDGAGDGGNDGPMRAF